ncbi:MAG: GGDEF domain-containing protein, partial [Erysipelotrichaceae bacterium]|nr:GGDEF domain-containing protein [Erysipelotrichaceae bacterium]
IGDFLCVYVVVPETGRYREYSSSSGFAQFDLPKEGFDFYKETLENCKTAVYKEDLERFLSLFSKEGILSEIERNGIFSMTYRLVMDQKPVYVQLRAAMVHEKEGLRLIVGINDIDTQVRQEEEYTRRLEQAQTQASIDALTRVKNRHAYLDAEEKLDQRISDGEKPEFSIVILDVNDLKMINDTRGHQAGDQYLVDSAQIICKIFKHSPVFRIGGDEFAVISQGSDYENIDELLKQVYENNRQAAENGGIVIACGMARYNREDSVAPVFELADQRMYENKMSLKADRS